MKMLVQIFLTPSTQYILAWPNNYNNQAYFVPVSLSGRWNMKRGRAGKLHRSVESFHRIHNFSPSAFDRSHYPAVSIHHSPLHDVIRLTLWWEASHLHTPETCYICSKQPLISTPQTNNWSHSHKIQVQLQSRYNEKRDVLTPLIHAF